MSVISDKNMVYEVENNGVKHFFVDRSMAMAYADDNNCFLVQGKTLRQALDENLDTGNKVQIEYYRQFKNQLSKA